MARESHVKNNTYLVQHKGDCEVKIWGIIYPNLSILASISIYNATKKVTLENSTLNSEIPDTSPR